jgi:hypothetical protein
MLKYSKQSQIMSKFDLKNNNLSTFFTLKHNLKLAVISVEKFLHPFNSASGGFGGYPPTPAGAELTLQVYLCVLPLRSEF